MGHSIHRIEYKKIPYVSRDLAIKFLDTSTSSDGGSQTMVYVCSDFIEEMREMLGGNERNSKIKKLVEENKLHDEFEEWLKSLGDDPEFDMMIGW